MGKISHHLSKHRNSSCCNFLRNDLIYLFMTVLGLHCHVGFSLGVESGGYSFLTAMCRLPVVVASRCLQALEHRLNSCGPWACSKACGFFPDQGSSLCLVHWQVESLPEKSYDVFMSSIDWL